MAQDLFSGFKEKTPPPPVQAECVSYLTLNVTVLRAKTNLCKDEFFESNLYVTLTLPTATATTRRTKTINNNNCPEWNEGFSFRVPSQTENELEIRVFDEKLLTGGLLSTHFMNLSSLQMNSRQSQIFNLNPQTEDALEMEFELRNSEDKPQEYPTNGILMAPPMSILNVIVENPPKSSLLSPPPVLELPGTFEGTVTLDSEQQGALRLHVNRELATELETKLMATGYLRLESCEMPEEQLSVRLELDVPPEEKQFLQKRRKVVAKALQSLLGLDAPPSEEQVPVIAVVASGGGSRACTGFLGSLKALKEIGVLDTVTYITAVSGSTWAMSALCQDENWSENLDSIISRTREQMTKSLTLWSPLKILDRSKEVKEKEQQGHLVSYIDRFGLILEELVFGPKITSTLSDQQKTVKDGQNPLPIYTAVNKKEDYPGQRYDDEWVEFTPFEVGLQKYGAFVRAEDFGSKFFLGHLIEKLREIRLPFLMGIWSSAISETVEGIWNHFTKADTEADKPDNADGIEDELPLSPETLLVSPESGLDDSPPTADILLVNPESGLGSAISGLSKKRLFINETFNFTRGLSLHQDYSSHSHFLAWKESHPDALPNQLTPSDPTLRLIDSGLSINIGCPPVLRPERGVDIIIVLSYSWDKKDIFKVLEETAEFCEERKIPFPKADYSQLQQQPQRELYVIKDPQTPRAPTVLHLPLVNASYREHKAPGVRRQGPEEEAEGRVDVDTDDSPFVSENLTYSTTDYDSLFHLTSYNVLASRDAILTAIRDQLRGLDRD